MSRNINSIGLGFGLAAVGLVAVGSTSLLHAEAPPSELAVDRVSSGMPCL